MDRRSLASCRAREYKISLSDVIRDHYRIKSCLVVLLVANIGKLKLTC